MLPPSLRCAGQGKQGLSVALEAERSGSRLAGQQGQRPTATPPAPANLCTPQMKDGALLKSLSHPDNMRLPASCLSQLTHGDDPDAFLWVYEGSAMACGLSEEEAGREQPSSNCSPGATLLYQQKLFSFSSALSSVLSLVRIC